MANDFLRSLRHQIGPVDDKYLRPFVSDGDPRECPLVLLGYCKSSDDLGPMPSKTKGDICSIAFG